MKRSLKIILISLFITALLIASLVFYLLYTVQKEKEARRLVELTKFWANGVRCPETNAGFSIPSKPEDWVSTGGARFVVNVVEVNFTDGATCEDAEYIAQLLNGRIVGFDPVTNLYAIEIPTRTIPELQAAIQKLRDLNDPKIEGVFEAVELPLISQ